MFLSMGFDEEIDFKSNESLYKCGIIQLGV